MTIGDSALRYIGVVLGASLPRSQTSSNERELLKKYIGGKKCIAEIGVFEGFTTRVLTECSDADARIYGVDPFFSGRLGISWGYKMSQAYNYDAIRRGKLSLVRAKSIMVGNQVPSELDFVFIDADHSLDGIISDWEFWSERIKADGVIALHDSLIPNYNPRVADYGSHLYFEQHIKFDRRFEFIDCVDSLAIMKRRSK